MKIALRPKNFKPKSERKQGEPFSRAIKIDPNPRPTSDATHQALVVLEVAETKQPGGELSASASKSVATESASRVGSVSKKGIASSQLSK